MLAFSCDRTTLCALPLGGWRGPENAAAPQRPALHKGESRQAGRAPPHYFHALTPKPFIQRAGLAHG